MAERLKKVEQAIFVCTGSSCKSAGGKRLAAAAKAIVKERVGRRGRVVRTKCTGQCKHSVVVYVQPDDAWYGEVELEDLPNLLRSIR